MRNRFYHAASDRLYSMSIREGVGYMRREQAGFRGEPDDMVERRIDYVMGSGHKVQTFLHRNDWGELLQMPVAWYSENGGFWAMNPSYDRPDHDDFRRRIRYDCFFCHNAFPAVTAGRDSFYADARYPAALPEGIDCQRCHGPGSEHVALAGRRASPASIRSAIVNPARLPAEQRLEICLQCHLQSTSRALPYSTTRMGKGVFSFRPGQLLADYALHYDRAGDEDGFEIAHAGYRLMKSACFRQSGGKLGCTTCHNPHDVQSGPAAASRYEAACRGCHVGAHKPGEDCASCHMPQRRTDDVVHVVMTDHRIQRQKPAGDLTRPRAEVPEGAAPYRGEVLPFYPRNPAATPANELDIAVAQVRAGANFGEGIPRLRRLVEKYKPARAEYYYELAEAYWKSGDTANAFRFHEFCLSRDPGSLPCLRDYGMELSANGQLRHGAELLTRALKLAPDDTRTLHDLALTYSRQSRKREAIALLRKAVAIDPDTPESHNALAAELHALGDVAGAESEFRESIRWRPDYALARDNLARLLASQGRYEEAAYHARKAQQGR